MGLSMVHLDLKSTSQAVMWQEFLWEPSVDQSCGDHRQHGQNYQGTVGPSPTIVASQAQRVAKTERRDEQTQHQRD
jgi:hypothetical protein